MKLALLLLALAPQDKTEVVVVRAGRVVTVSKGVIDEGVILIRLGKIEKIGRGIDVPLDARVIDLGKNATVVPGFIDLHSHVGSVTEVDETTDSVTPGVRAIDAFSSDHPDVRRAAESGVTLIALSPGNANLVGGRLALVRPGEGPLHRLLFRDSAALKMCLTAEALPRDREPTSRSGAMDLLRRHLKDASGGVAQVLFKEGRPAFVRAASADEIQRAVALRQEFGFRMVVLGADEAVHALDDLKKGPVGVAFGPLTVSDDRERLETPGRVAKAGVRIAFTTNAPATPEHYLRLSAAIAVKYGLDRDDALRALTLWPAEMLGIAEQVGSLEEGKIADLVAYAGDPLSLASGVELVVIAGRVAYQRKKG